MNSKKIVLNILISATIIFLPSTVRADIYDDHKIPDNIRTKIEKLVDGPSYLEGVDNFKRKPRQKRIEDNIDWYEKYGKVNERYNQYCLDIENSGDQDNFLDKSNGLDPQENADISKRTFSTTDKLSLYSAVHEKYKELNRPIYFRFKGAKVLEFKYSKINGCKKTQSALKKLPDGKFFIKPQGGSLGNDTMLLVKKGSSLKFQHVKKGKISLKKFIEITKSKNFFVQDYIEQHQALKKLNPSSVNTVRIITTKFNDEAQILCAILKIGTNSKSIVDNASKGGCFVGVDAVTGKLQKYGGCMAKYKVIQEHPESKIKFENYQLPFWKECIETAKKLQMMSTGYTSMGWDIAITPTGPVLIEGNSQWGDFTPTIVCRGLRENWEKLKKI